MKRQIEGLARQRMRWRQAALRWAKKMKPFEDIIACLVGLGVGIAMGMAVFGAYNLHNPAASRHRHHAETAGAALAAPLPPASGIAHLASLAACRRLARCETTPTSPRSAA